MQISHLSALALHEQIHHTEEQHDQTERKYVAQAPGEAVVEIGSLLIFHAAIVFPLVIALIVMAVIAGATRLLSRTDPEWVHAS